METIEHKSELSMISEIILIISEINFTFIGLG